MTAAPEIVEAVARVFARSAAKYGLHPVSQDWRMWQPEARAAIAAHEAALKEAGYVIAPRAPTEAMYDAGSRCEPFNWPGSRDPHRLWHPGEIVATAVWRAMIAALGE